MAHINRRYIDKHWLVFMLRGGMAAVFGFVVLFGGLEDLETTVSMVAVFLLFMGIVDAVSALYSSTKRRGWVNSVIDAMVDVAAALCLLFFARNHLANTLIILAIYTILSGVIDIFHGFISTVDPTDRFIRILAGIVGCVLGIVIMNSGSFEIMTFIRFFGAYLLIVGVTSMIYGVHNREQKVEDKVARKEAAKKAKLTRAAKKNTKALPAKKSAKTK